MSQADTSGTEVEQQRELTVEEKAEKWVLEPADSERPLEVEGTVNISASIRVPRDATEEEKKNALLAQVFHGEIDDVTGVTVWGQSFAAPRGESDE